MANNIFSFTKRDYEGSRKEGLSKIPVISNGLWTDLNATDPGIIILDYVHALVDMVQYYQDHQALESFIVTARERSNIFRLARQMSYHISSASSAKVYIKFYIDYAYEEDLKIPKGTKVATNTGIEYFTIDDAYLKAGELEVSVLCVQGVSYTKIYEGTGLSRFSNVEPPANTNQTVVLTADNVDIDSISIVDNLGRIWERVDSIVFTGSEDRVFQADLTPENTILIQFGDGERGVIPQDTDVLTIDYIVSDAEDGNVSIGSINNILDTLYDPTFSYVPFKVINEEESTGGASPQSSESIRELAPGAIKAQDRAVTLSDFMNLAKLVPGVADAKAYDINVNPDIPYNEVRLLIIPTISTRSKPLLNTVYNFISSRMIPPTNLVVSYPSNITIDIDITVKSIGNIEPINLEYQVRDTIVEYFDRLNSEVGEDFYPTDLSATVSSLPNVKYVVSMTPAKVVTIEDTSSASLGTLNITVQ